jgi:hypothetical protein
MLLLQTHRKVLVRSFSTHQDLIPHNTVKDLFQLRHRQHRAAASLLALVLVHRHKVSLSQTPLCTAAKYDSEM